MKQYVTNYFFILFLCFFSEITLAIPKIGSQAPNLSATLFTGKTFEINKMKGENLLLNFYSSYSKHCAYEIGSIETFLERHGSKIRIIYIGVDRPQDKHRVERMTKIYNIEGFMLNEAIINEGYEKPSRTPRAILIDKTGKVISINVGAKTPKYFKELETFIYNN